MPPSNNTNTITTTTTTTTTATKRIPIVLIGAGPQALALAAALLEPQPYTLDDAASLAAAHHRSSSSSSYFSAGSPPLKASDILVIDPAGQWMSGWKDAFAYLEIPVLRSHLLAHPDPHSELALLDVVTAAGGRVDGGAGGVDLSAWNNRLLKKNKKMGKKKQQQHHHHQQDNKIKPFLQDHGFLFARPSTVAFHRLCDDLVERYRLRDKIVAAKALSLTPHISEENNENGNEMQGVRVELSNGQMIEAGRVICCMGPNGGPRIPTWAKPHYHMSLNNKNILHSTEIPRLGLPCPPTPLYYNKHVLIVGGGLTAAHLFLSAQRHGAASVTMVVRRKMRVMEYCFDLRWAGRARHLHLAEYRAQPLEERMQTLREERPGGTITPDMMAKLQELVGGSGVGEGGDGNKKKNKRKNVCGKGKGGEEGGVSLQLLEETEVVDLKVMKEEGRGEGEGQEEPCASSSSWWSVTLSNGQVLPRIDQILLATGTEVDVKRDPLLGPLLAAAGGGCDNSNSKSPGQIEGYPIVDRALRLEKLSIAAAAPTAAGGGGDGGGAGGLNVHVMGMYAALQVGPNAGNLMGAMIASRLLADEIRRGGKGGDRGEEGGEGDGVEEEGEEGDVEDIHGLNNPFDLLREEEEDEEEEN